MIEHEREYHFLATARQKLRIALRRGLAPRRRRGQSSTPHATAEAALIAFALCAEARHGAPAHRPAPRPEHFGHALAEEIAVMLLHATIGDETNLAVEPLLERGAALGRVGRMCGLESPQHLGKRLRAIQQLAHRRCAVM